MIHGGETVEKIDCDKTLCVNRCIRVCWFGYVNCAWETEEDNRERYNLLYNCILSYLVTLHLFCLIYYHIYTNLVVISLSIYIEVWLEVLWWK